MGSLSVVDGTFYLMFKHVYVSDKLLVLVWEIMLILKEVQFGQILKYL